MIKGVEKSVIYKCKENDAVIRLFSNDIFIDEVHIQIEGENGWIVIGYKDLQKAIAKAEKKFNPKKLRVCPQCSRKHNELSFNVFCCEACWNGY